MEDPELTVEERLVRWGNTAKKLAGPNEFLKIMIAGLGRTDSLIAEQEQIMHELITNAREDFDVPVQCTPWFDLARYWVKELFDALYIIDRLAKQNAIEVDTKKLESLKKTLSFLRQPMAKTQSPKIKSKYQAPEAFFNPNDRSFGWQIHDGVDTTYMISRFWIGERFLDLASQSHYPPM